MNNKAKRGTLKRVLKYIEKRKFLLLLSILLTVISVALSLYVPYLVGEAIDYIVEGAVIFEKIIYLLISATVFTVICGIIQWVVATINNRITYHTVRDMRNDAFRKIQKLPLSYLDTHRTGDTLSRVINDVDTFSEGLLLGFTQLFSGVSTIVGVMCFMFLINWVIALAVLLLTPISLFVAKFISKSTHDMFVMQSKTKGQQTALIDEIIGNQKLVKAFGYEAETKKKFDIVNDDLQKYSLRAIFFSSLVNPTTRFVNSIVYAAVTLIGAIFCIMTAGSETAFTVGMLTILLSYTNQYTKPFNEISGVIAEFQNALVCAERILELIDESPETSDADKKEIIGQAVGNVDIKNASFSYTKDKKLIENLSVSIPDGKRCAIVGPTGCGKTTLINLLMRFYDVDDGEIDVDGVDIRDLKRHSLRKNYGMVLQQTWLKSATVKENIAFGKTDATDEEIIAAAKATHAHGFIIRLKDGYDTLIGEGGTTLSEGQKQLLCITRVMLSLPPMLILDEATSSIDTRTEMRIQSAFAKMMSGRTSFIVAHRLSTVREADIILVMRDGNIVEKGTHNELLEKNGFYAELYNSQFAH